MKLWFSIYRYNREINVKPYMQDYFLDIKDNRDIMVLDALIALKEKDPTLSFRRSCREGVCGSDGMNMNGKNGLACITPISKLSNKKQKIIIRPLPGLPIIRDLVVDMDHFYSQYKKIKPFLLNNEENNPEHEHLQSPAQRELLDGLYECVLCGCCSTACPSFWWNPDKFIGPAGLLTLYRFLIDSRDTETNSRLDNLYDAFSVFRCHNIMNCVSVCPKGLNPTRAINEIKLMLLKHNN
ncbi:succinate dehydrogenase iron-sulfur subunit [Candidatus Pantoea edessiphila]|uniref:Succinate dehydrogenase iron-sulfur subunit n=1 Tax=Candidatus Pantoea edessiphila TaxID=2044610 RepID=A0A2P5SZ31_9GAMM|nr:succinate dehydrogenase iron-sulfur subunit [Candidatus Pantoea edessiphila]MBK4775299.1 succinate dehydrogenase iron-sulfur subunit [Pantoea sp. Edef]PPI87563.1 succinate dehydrogenase iron-sulfur subunit [Candidatus Pantoea edessiphila]